MPPSLGLASPRIKQGLGVNQASVPPLRPPAQEETDHRRDPAARAPGSVHTACLALSPAPAPHTAPGLLSKTNLQRGCPPPRRTPDVTEGSGRGFLVGAKTLVGWRGGELKKTGLEALV